MIQQVTKLEQLILAILSRIAEKDGYATKTKLLKILYLIDVEYYRRHGQTFTGFNWIYYHYGPWTKEYEEALTDLIKMGKVDCQSGSRPDLDTKFLNARWKADIDTLFHDLWDQYNAKNLIDTWAPEATGKILDYVYFETEPMAEAVRGKALDFAKIRREEGKTGEGQITHSIWLKQNQKTLKEAKQRFQEVKAKAKKNEVVAGPDPAPRYDDVYFEAMTLLDQDE